MSQSRCRFCCECWLLTSTSKLRIVPASAAVSVLFIYLHIVRQAAIAWMSSTVPTVSDATRSSYIQWSTSVARLTASSCCSFFDCWFHTITRKHTQTPWQPVYRIFVMLLILGHLPATVTDVADGAMSYRHAVARAMRRGTVPPSTTRCTSRNLRALHRVSPGSHSTSTLDILIGWSDDLITLYPTGLWTSLRLLVGSASKLNFTIHKC